MAPVPILVVDRALEALGNHADHLDDVLLPQGVREFRDFRILLGMKHALGEALAVAKVDEDHAAMVAGGIHPTDEGDGLADVGLAEFVAVVGTHGRNSGRRRTQDFKIQEEEVAVSWAVRVDWNVDESKGVKPHSLLSCVLRLQVLSLQASNGPSGWSKRSVSQSTADSALPDSSIRLARILSLSSGILGSDDEGEAGSGFLGALELFGDLRGIERKIGRDPGTAEVGDEFERLAAFCFIGDDDINIAGGGIALQPDFHLHRGVGGFLDEIADDVVAHRKPGGREIDGTIGNGGNERVIATAAGDGTHRFLRIEHFEHDAGVIGEAADDREIEFDEFAETAGR